MPASTTPMMVVYVSSVRPTYGASSRTPRISSTSTAPDATKTISGASPRGSTSAPQPGDRLDHQIPEPWDVEGRRHARVRPLTEPAVEIDHGRAARPAPRRLDRHEGVDGRDHARRGDERDGAGIVHRRRGESEPGAVRRAEEGQPAGDDVGERRPQRVEPGDHLRARERLVGEVEADHRE